MTEEVREPILRPSQQLAALLGLPDPLPFTDEEKRRYRKKADRANAGLKAAVARGNYGTSAG